MVKLQKLSTSYIEHTCTKPGANHPIPRGEGYYRWKFRYGPVHCRCLNHPPEAWELESNAKRQALMRADSAVTEAKGSITAEDAASKLFEARDHAQEALDAFQETVSSWDGTNLEYSERYQTFADAASQLEDWVADVEAIANELETFEQDHEDDEDEDFWYLMDDIDPLDIDF